MGLRETLLAQPVAAPARPSIRKPAVQSERSKAHPLAVRHATQVAAFGVLTHPDDANTPDDEDLGAEFYHKAQAGIVYERISPADRTLTDDLPTESLAFDDIEVAHSLALAQINDWRVDKHPRQTDFCWELAWRLEEMLTNL